MSTEPTAAHNLWQSPLMWAAGITWVAVVLQSVDLGKLMVLEPRSSAGLAVLLGFAALMLLETRCGERPALQRGLTLAQGLCAVLAAAVLRDGSTAILLIIVAAQVVALWPQRQALLVMAGLNLLLALAWLQVLPLPRVLLFLAPMIGFQLFAGLTMHYAVSAERARRTLQQTHAELLATRQLLSDSARAEERLRLSRELHDVAGHKLTALKLNLRLLQREPAFAGHEGVATALTLADELLGDIRGVVSHLRLHEGVDLAAAIQTLVRVIPGPHFELDIDPGLKVASVQQAEVLLRCVQEAITNALRHGRPRTLTVRLARIGDELRLTVEDDGHAAPKLREGNGLTGMRERLAALKGRLAVEATGRGVRLTAELPA
jgi:signal transduction histidine kinase